MRVFRFGRLHLRMIDATRKPKDKTASPDALAFLDEINVLTSKEKDIYKENVSIAPSGSLICPLCKKEEGFEICQQHANKALKGKWRCSHCNKKYTSAARLNETLNPHVAEPLREEPIRSKKPRIDLKDDTGTDLFPANQLPSSKEDEVAETFYRLFEPLEVRIGMRIGSEQPYIGINREKLERCRSEYGETLGNIFKNKKLETLVGNIGDGIAIVNSGERMRSNEGQNQAYRLLNTLIASATSCVGIKETLLEKLRRNEHLDESSQEAFERIRKKGAPSTSKVTDEMRSAVIDYLGEGDGINLILHEVGTHQYVYGGKTIKELMDECTERLPAKPKRKDLEQRFAKVVRECAEEAYKHLPFLLTDHYTKNHAIALLEKWFPYAVSRVLTADGDDGSIIFVGGDTGQGKSLLVRTILGGWIEKRIVDGSEKDWFENNIHVKRTELDKTNRRQTAYDVIDNLSREDNDTPVTDPNLWNQDADEVYVDSDLKFGDRKKFRRQLTRYHTSNGKGLGKISRSNLRKVMPIILSGKFDHSSIMKVLEKHVPMMLSLMLAYEKSGGKIIRLLPDPKILHQDDRFRWKEIIYSGRSYGQLGEIAEIVKSELEKDTDEYGGCSVFKRGALTAIVSKMIKDRIASTSTKGYGIEKAGGAKTNWSVEASRIIKDVYHEKWKRITAGGNPDNLYFSGNLNEWNGELRCELCNYRVETKNRNDSGQRIKTVFVAEKCKNAIHR
ncbi:MAG: hypothetical protein OYG31_03330 [Candidatus Kaiserbacteria bacterium]|nr:hypothetical protein [Candidatus Kaiserbacteria bacterium]